MKYTVNIMIIIALLICSVPCLAEDSDARKESAKLAAELLVGELQKKAASHPVDEGSLYKSINGDKTNNQEQSASRSKCLEQSKGALKSWFKLEVNRIVEQLDSGKKEGKSGWFSDKEKSELKLLPSETVEKNMGSNFEKAFTTARGKAVKDQWNNLVRDVYPTETEIETMNRAELRKKLLDRLIGKQKETVFGENKKLLGDNFIDPVLEDAAEQLTGQNGIVSQSSGGNEIAPESIDSFMRNEIEKYRAQLKKAKEGVKVASKVYEMFPGVSDTITKRSGLLATDKFSVAITRMEFPVTKESIKAFISKSLAAHAGKEKSRGICIEASSKAVQYKAIQEYAKNTPEKDKTAFTKHLQGLASGDAECQKALKGLIARSVNPGFETARKELSDEQFASLFGPLKEGTWRPADESIESNLNSMIPDIKDPLKIPGISTKTVDSNSLLEETLGKILEAEKNLLNQGIAALRGQMSTVATVGKGIRSQLALMPELPDLDGLIRSYEKGVLSTWESESKTDKYKALFAKAKNEIRRRAKDMLPLEIARREQIKQQEEKERKEAIEQERREEETQKKRAAMIKAIEKAREEAYEQRKVEEERQRKEDKKRADEEAKQAAADEAKRKTNEAKQAAAAAAAAKAQKDAGEGTGTKTGEDQGDGKGKEGAGNPGKSKGTDGDSGGGGKTAGTGGSGGGAGGGTGGGTGGGGGGGDDGDGQNPADAIIDIDYVNGKITAGIMFPKKSTVEFNFVLGYGGKIDPEKFLNSMNSAQRLFTHWFKSVSEKSTDEKDIKLYVVTRVFEGRVHYGVVFNFRQAIKNALEAVGDKRLRVNWHDGMFKKKFKGKREIPLDIRKQSRSMNNSIA